MTVADVKGLEFYFFYTVRLENGNPLTKGHGCGSEKHHVGG